MKSEKEGTGKERKGKELKKEGGREERRKKRKEKKNGRGGERRGITAKSETSLANNKVTHTHIHMRRLCIC